MKPHYRANALIASVALASIGHVPAAQAGCVHGRVRGSDGTPVQYANVMLVGTTLGAMTMSDGHFEIRGVQPGSYQLQVMMMMRKSVTRNVTITDRGDCGELLEMEMEALWPD